MAKPKLMNQAEYAAHRKAGGLPGGTSAAVLKAIKTGRIKTFDDGLIDPEVADIQWNKNTRPRVDYHAPPEPTAQGELLPPAGAELPAASASKGSEFWEAKTRETQAQARLKEMEVEVQAGRLIDRASYERAAFTAARQLRDALVLTFPQKYSARLAPMVDPWELEQALRGFLADELGAIAANLREIIQPLPEERHYGP